MSFGISIGSIAGGAIKSATNGQLSGSNIAKTVLSKVDIGSVIDKVPGMDSPKLKPIKKDIEALSKAIVKDNASASSTSLEDQIASSVTSSISGADTSSISKMDSKLSSASQTVKNSTTSKHEEIKSNLSDPGTTNITGNMSNKVSEISSQTGKDITMPEFNISTDVSIPNINTEN